MALEPCARAGNMPGMEPQRQPPILDMTPEGEFRDPTPPPAPGKLDRLLGRVGGIAVLVAVAAGGLVLAAVAILFAALALPVLIVAAAIGGGSIWWRLRRARQQGRPVSFVVIRR
jgi:predicted lipid-binding transport protein (Tim44 family)